MLYTVADTVTVVGAATGGEGEELLTCGSTSLEIRVTTVGTTFAINLPGGDAGEDIRTSDVASLEVEVAAGGVFVADGVDLDYQERRYRRFNVPHSDRRMAHLRRR